MLLSVPQSAIKSMVWHFHFMGYVDGVLPGKRLPSLSEIKIVICSQPSGSQPFGADGWTAHGANAWPAWLPLDALGPNLPYF